MCALFSVSTFHFMRCITAVSWAVVLCVCSSTSHTAVQLATTLHVPPPSLSSSDNEADIDEAGPVDVVGISFDEDGAGGPALAALIVATLEARGVAARAVPPPAACSQPDAAACLSATLALLARGELAAAVLPAPSAPPAPQLRDAGLEDLGDVAPPLRRTCFATGGELRSLLELADETSAARYTQRPAAISAAVASVDPGASPRYICGNSTTTNPCPSLGEKFAVVLTAEETEAKVMANLATKHGLRAHVVALGAPALRVAVALNKPTVVCGRALHLGEPTGKSLGPPPCIRGICSFDARRLLKLINVRKLAHAPSAIRSLGRITLDERELEQLRRTARKSGPTVAARASLEAHAEWTGATGEVRTAVMIPVSTHREAYDASALRFAAELAELDVALEASNLPRHSIEFKVELLDDGCAATRAFKYLTDALGSEFGALSGVAGPACGGAFGDVTRQSPALNLPVVAYTAQAPPAGAGAALTLLAAGDARLATMAWASLMAQRGWRRVAVLSELATRTQLDLPRLSADVLVHVELPGDSDLVEYQLIVQWARRAAAATARILYVVTEDARVVRAALCAAAEAGLSAAAGAVWLLPGALPAAWLTPAPADSHNCSRTTLHALAETHLSLQPAWAVRWDAGDAEGSEWRRRWRERCTASNDSACERPPAHAALLYDSLRLWAAALFRLLDTTPAAIDDLHREDLVRSLVEDATKTAFVGLTGEFSWHSHARTAPLMLQQWRNGSQMTVGTWRVDDGLALTEALRWRTADGQEPDDGGERCALRALAMALHVECRAANGAVAALVLAALLAGLAAAAWHCRRRAEREFRARLVALDMRAIGTKLGGLDRWEVPRERVVINRKLGTGAFGTVYGGHALLAEDRGWSAVAVKTLKVGASTEEKLDFLSEAEAMKRFDHKNVIRLLGVVTKTEPVCTVMEFMLYGDLKNYLVARRHLAGAGGPAAAEVAPARLTAMALDVARALSYLAQLRYVHRDVAARNCLVSANRVVKLADFGMTRLVFENDYYRFSRKGMLPVRWMAPESLALGVFSPASDVWSFGVLLYEIVTFGSLPFQGLSNAEVLARVKAGHTLDLPSDLKPQLQGLIESCWRRERGERPKAAAVAAFLAESPRLLAPCLDVPLDALPLAAAPPVGEGRWVSSAGTDSTYLSAEGAARETDSFLPSSPQNRDALAP